MSCQLSGSRIFLLLRVLNAIRLVKLRGGAITAVIANVQAAAEDTALLAVIFMTIFFLPYCQTRRFRGFCFFLTVTCPCSFTTKCHVNLFVYNLYIIIGRDLTRQSDRPYLVQSGYGGELQAKLIEVCGLPTVQLQLQHALQPSSCSNL